MSEETKIQDSVQESQQGLSQDELENIVSLKKGDIVTGTIVKVEDNQATVSLGYKYDGVVPLRELSSVQLDNANDAVKLGEEITLKVITIDDEKEKLVLSKKAVDGEKAWDSLQAQFEAGEVLEVTVADVVKGGLVVDVGVRGFIPASMVERHFVEDFKDYKGRTLNVKIKEIDRENNKIILSAKDVLEQEFEKNKQNVISGLEVGQELDGTVQRLTPFGAFVDIGGVDGLVHVSEMSWQHVAHPKDVVTEGQSVRVKVLKLDPNAGKISLSIKAAQPGPWESVSGQFKTGDIVTGTVRRLVTFGAFVEIAPGVEGLVHISQIAHRHVATPQEVLKEGQEVQAKILDFNPSEKRVSLSIKETEEAPEQAPRAERPQRERSDRGGFKEKIDNPNVSLSNQSMSFNLGERFGDKLSKFK
ncbi:MULTISPECIES: 30S ribosomal protein S1 [unclassified Paenibacillus]|uniref:30S ribosomal protein S1 n=1 Tax=unclassified Paenibacillus TaxID=185978 RepID=UPI000955C16C|nr:MULTISPECIES: 30S ribosomal protein S1 [unclassified Paenibacillus]ASS65106.1 30S ribosomal protein S1 [Paenibacillus sp. RUD330]SIQ48196.1 small subunit ribosomal protein S1 [Paenibacillus sp. RU4X]SIQ70106.1 small subunit ribosomal protein S1 [Paenibacillus sp. RU4T]